MCPQFSCLDGDNSSATTGRVRMLSRNDTFLARPCHVVEDTDARGGTDVPRTRRAEESFYPAALASVIAFQLLDSSSNSGSKDTDQRFNKDKEGGIAWLLHRGKLW